MQEHWGIILNATPPGVDEGLALKNPKGVQILSCESFLCPVPHISARICLIRHISQL
jgi:hypothetical protein